jgi:hydroxymethylpyrimidine pyrophosphatase-like HAD family hydrolase
VDICEDVTAWSSENVNALLELCKNEGAHAKISSIHVNVWYGDYDKYSGFKKLLSSPFASQWSLDQRDGKNWLFIGDSPNDEPLFKQFQFSVGVANLSKYLDQLKHPPRWITDARSGAGFCEMVEGLLNTT